ncbi:MAG TPA: hypothetical protein VFO77_08560, partial [Actinoplanes sp.]|nr:hypothetical protein [Actinoplanes sp.]
AVDVPGLSGRPPVRWPGPKLPGAALGDGLGLGCVTVTGDRVAPLQAVALRADAATAWSSGGKQWSVTFRPLLPDERDCTDLATR